MTSRQAVIFGTPGAWHCEKLARALKKRYIQPTFASINAVVAQLGRSLEVTFAGQPLSRFEFAFVREVPGGSLEQVIFRMDALHQLENSGLRILNSPYAIEKMVDKYYTLSLLQKAGLPVPETRVMESAEAALAAFHELGGDVVVKPLFGSRGVGMLRVTDPETAGRVFRALQMNGYVHYLQKFIPHNNRDLRLLVANGECIAAMERIANDWKTNVAVGAVPRHYKPTKEVLQLSLAAVLAVGADYCGVDLLIDESGEPFLLEVNSMPAWEGLQTVTGFDIAERIVEKCVLGERP